MTSVTFSADQYLLNKARRIAAAEHKTLNEVFREWLDQYTASQPGTVITLTPPVSGLQLVPSGKPLRAVNEH